MKDKNWLQIKEILVQALEKEPQQREEFLTEVCVDVELRIEVMKMLAYEEKVSNFLSEPLVNVAAMTKDESFNQANQVQLANQTKPRGLSEVLLSLKGETLDGKYQIQELLGQGGMGAVFKAVHLGTERPVALKIINPQFMMSNEFVERFKREAKAAGRLSHPNVVNVTDFGFAKVKEDIIAYLVMEYLNGFTLANLLEKKKILPLGFVIDILEQVCLAMELAHQKGIVHRDLKPDNIWLEPNERGAYNIKVLDFGVAKLCNSSPEDVEKGLVNSKNDKELAFQKSTISTLLKNQINTSSRKSTTLSYDNIHHYALPNLSTSVIKPQVTKEKLDNHNTKINTYFTEGDMIIGTPNYMSPEQCQGLELDARSDIYSLGVVAYKMLVGETPFKGDVSQIIFQHTNATAPNIKEKYRKIPLPIADLVTSALAKEPENRPVSAAAFALALKTAGEGEKPIIKKSVQLFGNNFIKLFCLSAIINLPLVIISSILICLLQQKPTIYPAFEYLSGFWWLLPLFIILLSDQLNTLVFAPIAREVYVNNSFRISVGQIFVNIIKIFPQMVLTRIKGMLSVLANIAMVTIKSKEKSFGLLLSDIVITVEQLRGKKALERAEQLIRPIRPLVVSIQIRSLIISFAVFFLSFLPFCLDEVIDFSNGRFLYYRLEEQDFYNTAFILILLVPGIIATFFRPIIAISSLQLYLKSRQILGEPKDLFTKQNEKDIYIPNYYLAKKSSKILLVSLMIVMLLLSSISYVLFVPPKNLVKVEIPKIEMIPDSENAWVEYKLALGELVKTNMLANVDLSVFADGNTTLDSNGGNSLAVLRDNHEKFYLEIANKLKDNSPLTSQQKSFLDSYQPAIKYLIDATKKSKAQYYQKEVNFKPLNLLTVMALAYITLAQSNRLMLEGKTQEATDTLLALYKFSTDMLSETYISKVNYLIANMVQGSVQRNLFHWMASSYSDLIDYEYLLKKISILEGSIGKTIEKVIQGKIETEEGIRRLVDNKDIAQSLGYQLEWIKPFYGLRLRTYNNLLEKHREQMQLLEPHLKNYDFPGIKNMIDRWKKPSSYFLSSQIKLLHCKTVLEKMPGDYYAMLKTTYILDSYRAAIRIFMSCLIYKKVHGYFPKTLKEAFYNNTATIPNDHVTHKPVRYRLENNTPVIWFAGYDGIDDGGMIDCERKNYSMAPPGRDWILRLGELYFWE